MSASTTSPLVRLHPVGAAPAALVAQFGLRARPKRPITLLRSVREDPLAVDLGDLPLPLGCDGVAVAAAWADAQLAADSTLLGLALGLRVVLVPEAGRWYADVLVIRTGGRLRTRRGSRDPKRALAAIRRSFLASMRVATDESRGCPP